MAATEAIVNTEPMATMLQQMGAMMLPILQQYSGPGFDSVAVGEGSMSVSVGVDGGTTCVISTSTSIPHQVQE